MPTAPPPTPTPQALYTIIHPHIQFYYILSSFTLNTDLTVYQTFDYIFQIYCSQIIIFYGIIRLICVSMQRSTRYW